MRLSVTSVSLVTAMFVASLGAGSALADGDTVILQLYGQRAWEVSCEMEQSDGDTIASRERGGGMMNGSRAEQLVDVAAGDSASRGDEHHG